MVGGYICNDGLGNGDVRSCDGFDVVCSAFHKTSCIGPVLTLVRFVPHTHRSICQYSRRREDDQVRVVVEEMAQGRLRKAQLDRAGEQEKGGAA